jgi:hypothetical protein
MKCLNISFICSAQSISAARGLWQKSAGCLRIHRTVEIVLTRKTQRPPGNLCTVNNPIPTWRRVFCWTCWSAVLCINRQLCLRKASSWIEKKHLISFSREFQFDCCKPHWSSDVIFHGTMVQCTMFFNTRTLCIFPSQCSGDGMCFLWGTNWSAHTVYLCVPYGSHNKQRLFP